MHAGFVSCGLSLQIKVFNITGSKIISINDLKFGNFVIVVCYISNQRFHKYGANKSGVQASNCNYQIYATLSAFISDSVAPNLELRCSRTSMS